MAGSLHRNEPWRVGVLFSQSGPTAIIEDTQLKGMLFAIDEVNEAGGVNGRSIEPVIYDPASDPEKFNKLADRLLTQDGVKTIFGCYMSSTRKAVLPVVERRNGLLFYPTLYEGFEYSPHVIYTGAAPNQNSVQLAAYLFETYGNRFYLVGSNYVYPHETNRVVKELVAEGGGTIVGEHYVELDETNFRWIIGDIRHKQPDVIFSTVVGRSTIHFYRAYAEAGLDPASMPIASLTTCEAEVRAMGAGVACGHITAAPYFQSIDTPRNHDFVRRIRARFGEDMWTNMCLEGAYVQVHIFARALERAESVDADVLRPAVLGLEYEAPQGRVRIDPDNGHTYLWPRIGRVGEGGDFVIVRESTRPVKPDPYLIQHSLDDWGADLTSFRSQETVLH